MFKGACRVNDENRSERKADFDQIWPSLGIAEWKRDSALISARTLLLYSHKCTFIFKFRKFICAMQVKREDIDRSDKGYFASTSVL